MIRYRPEEPRVLSEEKGPTYDLAAKVADWIEDRRESNYGWVAGVYGGRGTGKTSFLITVLDILQKSDQKREAEHKAPVLVLPAVDKKHILRGLLAPAATRSDDDLLFLVLDHIEKRYGSTAQGQEIKEPMGKARMAEVKRKDQKSFLEYAREVSPSIETLPRALVELHTDIATTTQSLKEAFENIVKHLRGPRQLILPLFVDDIDLRPERALELLEIAHLFLNLPGVVVVVTADRDLLLHAIARALEGRGVKHPGLAAALLAKYVPHAWMLPIPNEQDRLTDLWPEEAAANVPVESAVPSTTTEPQAQPGLHRWWPEKAADFFAEHLPMRERAAVMLGSLLPPSFRGLAAMHNRLLSLQDDWRVEAGADHFMVALGERFSVPLGILPELIPPFVSMVVALDVWHPELGLLELLNQDPSVLSQVLERTLARIHGRRTPSSGDGAASRAPIEPLANVAIALDRLAVASEEPLWRADDPDEIWPALDCLRPPHLEGRHVGGAKRLLEHLAAQWAALRELTPLAPPAGRFLPISFRENALDESRRIWSARFPASQVRDWHLDLRSLVHNVRPAPAEMDRARSEAIRFLRRRLASFPGRIALFASAPLSFLIWLGWALDERREFTVYAAKTRNLFAGPSERLTFPDRGRYELCEVEPPFPEVGSASEQDGHAILLINLTGGPGSVDDFSHADASVQGRVRCILRRRSDAPIEPEDLVPILRDILELLGQLHRDHGIRHIHLAFAGPDAVAFFLGRQLKATGMAISLYELYGSRHEYVFDLEESPSGAA